MKVIHYDVKDERIAVFNKDGAFFRFDKPGPKEPLQDFVDRIHKELPDCQIFFSEEFADFLAYKLAGAMDACACYIAEKDPSLTREQIMDAAAVACSIRTDLIKQHEARGQN